MERAVGSERLKLGKTQFLEVPASVRFLLFEIKGSDGSASSRDGDESLAEWAARDCDDVASDGCCVAQGKGFHR